MSRYFLRKPYLTPRLTFIALLTLASPSRALTINLTYDNYVMSSPYAAQIMAAVNKAAQLFQNTYFNPVTVNIQVGWGEMQGTPMSGLGHSSFYWSGYYGVSQIEQSLLATPQSKADQSAYLSLPPPSLYSNTSGVWVPTALAQALGLTTATVQAYVSFGSQYSYTFDHSTGVASGTFDLIGVAEHEISEVLGRISGVGVTWANGPGILDLFRYSAPATPVFANVPSYFSINNGSTALANFNTNLGGDTGDWANDSLSVGDAAVAFANSGTVYNFTSTDVATLDVIGWSTVPISTVSPVSGTCGPANGVAVGTAPTSGLCNTGTPSAVSGTGPWTWSCVGSNGGSTAYCSAPLLTVAMPPPAPTNLIANASASKGRKSRTSYRVNLTWSQGSSVTYNTIYRATGAATTCASTSPMVKSSSAITSFTDSNVVHGTTYAYCVIAGNSGGVSAFSNLVNVTP